MRWNALKYFLSPHSPQSPHFLPKFTAFNAFLGKIYPKTSTRVLCDSWLRAIHFSHDVIMLPDTFIAVEMIPLRPHKDELAVSYPGFHMLCSLDTIKIQRSGCQLESITRVPHTCNMTQNEYVIEDEIESTINIGTGFGHLDDGLVPQEEPRAATEVRSKLSHFSVTIYNVSIKITSKSTQCLWFFVSNL